MLEPLGLLGSAASVATSAFFVYRAVQSAKEALRVVFAPKSTGLPNEGAPVAVRGVLYSTRHEGPSARDRVSDENRPVLDGRNNRVVALRRWVSPPSQMAETVMATQPAMSVGRYGYVKTSGGEWFRIRVDSATWVETAVWLASASPAEAGVLIDELAGVGGLEAETKIVETTLDEGAHVLVQGVWTQRAQPDGVPSQVGYRTMANEWEIGGSPDYPLTITSGSTVKLMITKLGGSLFLLALVATTMSYTAVYMHTWWVLHGFDAQELR